MVTSHRIVLHDGEPYPENAFRPVLIPGTGLALLDKVERNENRSLSPLILLQAYRNIATKYPDQASYRQRYDQLLDSLEKTHPDNPLVLSDLAYQELSTRTPEGDAEALRHLARAVASSSTSLSDYVLLAELLVRTAQPEGAVKVLKQALSLAPYNPLLYQDLAVAYWFAGKYEECSGTLGRGLKLFPGDLVQQAMLKRCQVRSGVSH
jgi:tetratricopeptide (TPR) repeat protein